MVFGLKGDGLSEIVAIELSQMSVFGLFGYDDKITLQSISEGSSGVICSAELT
jgi:hypothetical protein